MMQVGRNLTDPLDGFLARKRFLIIDRDSKYSTAFRDLLEESGVGIVRLPAQSPDLIFFGERSSTPLIITGRGITKESIIG